MDRVFLAAKNDHGKRIDNIIKSMFPGIPPSALYRAIRLGKVRINNKRTDPSCKVKEGDTIEVKHLFYPEASGPKKEESDFDKPELPLELASKIIFRTSGLLAINKPAGIPVHGRESLYSLMLPYLKSLTTPSLSFTPGPLHRLDKGTSGLLFFGLSLEAAHRFSELLKNREIRKSYLGLFKGEIKKPLALKDLLNITPEGKVSAGHGGREASTSLYPLLCSPQYTLAQAVISTGIKHQIRVQSAFHGHPLAGDTRYGGRDRISPYLLHAYRYSLEKKDPLLNFKFLTASLPERAFQVLKTAFPGKKEDDFLKLLEYNEGNDAFRF